MYKVKNEMDNMDAYRSLLEEVSVNVIDLSKDQDRALDLFKNGKNVLMMGSAGVGKSKCIREMKYHASKMWGWKSIVLCGTTGISSFSIGGITLNSFMGISTGEETVEVLLKRICRRRAVKERLQSVEILVVDELSMLSAELFEKINVIFQSIRRNNKFFGGIQVVFSMDLMQLQPVFNRRTMDGNTEQDKRLIFESDVFTKEFNKKNKNIVNLTTNFRQAGDKDFIDMLMRIRKGEQTQKDIDILKTRVIDGKIDVNDAVYLVSSNKQAQSINMDNLKKLKMPVYTYHAEFSENGDVEVCGELTRELQSQFLQKGIINIELKQYARVMLIKNISVEEGLVNGAVGTVLEFENGLPVVKFDSGIQRTIGHVEFEIEYNNSKSKVSQVPLMLCWAITTHKSQSLTLEKAVMNLGDCFCPHMAYVALSRVRDLKSLYLSSFNPAKIMVCEKSKEFVENI